jgi:hypothetical protein
VVSFIGVFTRVRSGIAIFILLAAMLGLVAVPAFAEGTVTIQHNDGTIDTYHNVAIKIIHNALFVTSVDGRGTIVINRAACAYEGDTLVCLPTAVTLVQSGTSQVVDLASGTIYANMTGQKQQLKYSSMQLPAHSILLSITTKKGTYLNLTGVIDMVKK